MCYSKIRHIEKLVFSVLAYLETFRNSLYSTEMNARLHCDDEINKALRDSSSGDSYMFNTMPKEIKCYHNKGHWKKFLISI